MTVTSEDVCWSIRNVKFINESFYNMRCLVMFISRNLFDNVLCGFVSLCAQCCLFFLGKRKINLKHLIAR